MKKEIGSSFWMNTDCLVKSGVEKFVGIRNLEEFDITYYSSGRGAIKALIKQYDLAGKKVMLPVFCCHTVFEPFMRAKCKICYYRIRRDFTVDLEEFLFKSKRFKPQYIIVMSYFGKGTLENLKPALDKLKAEGIRIIEDLTQSMYSDCRYRKADFYVGSLRKWGPVTDGGFLAARETPDLPLKTESNFLLTEYKMRAMQKKYEYMELGEGMKSDFLLLQSLSEQLVDGDAKIYSMSDIGKQMYATWNMDELRERRRENYEILLHGFEGLTNMRPVLGELERNEVPLYFMIYYEKNRDILQEYLKQKEIYAPVIWPQMAGFETELDAEGKYIYDHMLAIPCDQRYTGMDMQRVLTVLGNFSEEMVRDNE